MKKKSINTTEKKGTTINLSLPSFLKKKSDKIQLLLNQVEKETQKLIQDKKEKYAKYLTNNPKKSVTEFEQEMKKITKNIIEEKLMTPFNKHKQVLESYIEDKIEKIVDTINANSGKILGELTDKIEKFASNAGVNPELIKKTKTKINSVNLLNRKDKKDAVVKKAKVTAEKEVTSSKKTSSKSPAKSIVERSKKTAPTKKESESSFSDLVTAQPKKKSSAKKAKPATIDKGETSVKKRSSGKKVQPAVVEKNEMSSAEKE